MDRLEITIFCRMFRSWALLTHPEIDLDLYINEFENDFEQFKLFYENLVK